MKTLATILAMITIVAANLVVDFLIATSPSQLQFRVERELAKFIATEFRVDKVKFDWPPGISIYGLQILDASDDSGQESVLAIPLVRMRLDLFRQAITRVSIDSPNLSLRVDKRGDLNLTKMLKERIARPPTEKLEIPEFEIVSGSIFLDAWLGKRDLVKTELHRVSASVKTADGAVILTGSALSPVLGSIDFRASANSKLNRLDASVTAERVVLFRALRDSLPASIQSIWDEVNPSGLAVVEGKLRYDEGMLSYEATIECVDCAASLRSFPIPISLVNGKIRVKKNSISLDGFNYVVNGVSGRTEGVIEGDLKSPRIFVGTEVREIPLNDAVRSALSEGTREVWDDYSPRGKVDLIVRLSKEEGSPAGLKPYIEAIGTGEASVEYQGFKYRLDNLRGSFVIDAEDIFIRNVISQTASQIVRIDGEIRKSGQVGVLVEGADVKIDEKLLSALPEDQRKIVDSFGLSGEIDILVNVAGQKQSQPVGVTVEVIPKGKTRARPRDFPVLVESISGRVIIAPDGRVLLRQLRGKIGEGDVSVRDTAFGKSQTSELNLRCLLRSIPIDESLMNAVSYAAKADLLFVQLSGYADADLTLLREEGSKELRLFCAVVLKDASLVYKEIPIPATDLSGYLEIAQDGLRIKSLRGKCGKGTVLIWGEVFTSPEKASVRLNIEAHKITLDEQLRDSLPTELKEIYESFSPSGRATVAVRLTGGLGKSDPQIRLTLDNCSLKHTSFPYRVTGVNGSVKINPSAGEVVIELTTTEPALLLRGKSKRTDVQQDTELQIESEEISLTPELRDALPEGVRQVLAALSIKGSFGISLTLSISQEANQEPYIRYSAEVTPRKCSFFAGLLFAEVSGKVTLEGEVLPNGQHKLNLGRLQFSDFTIANRRVQWMSAKIVLEGDRIEISPVSGKIAGGTVEGEISAAVAGKTEYSGKLSVTDANIRDAAEDIFGKKIESASGYASAWLEFSGESPEISAFRATGGVKFREANLVEVPVISEIIRYFSGAGVSFEAGNARFDIKKECFYFDELKFKSRVCNLDGVGKMRFDGKLDLIFSVEWLGKVLPLGLRDFVKIIQDNLFQLGVTGDLRRVTIKQVSFKPLGDILKTLVEEEKDQK